MWPKIDVRTHHSASGPCPSRFQKDAQEGREQEATKESSQHQNAKNVLKVKNRLLR